MAEHGKIARIEYEFEDEFLYKNIYTIIPNKFSLSFRFRSKYDVSETYPWDKWFYCIFSESSKYVRDIWDSNVGVSIREKAEDLRTCIRDIQVAKLV